MQLSILARRSQAENRLMRCVYKGKAGGRMPPGCIAGRGRGLHSDVLRVAGRNTFIAEEDDETDSHANDGNGAREVAEHFHAQPRDARLRSSAARFGCIS